MKKLFLLRHGEAGTSPGRQDKTRPLTPKGGGDALALGPVLKSRHEAPELVLCSSATRTQQTCQNVLQAFENDAGHSDITVQICNELYNAPRGVILETIQAAAPHYKSILVIGHNPGLNELALTMAAEGAPTLMNRLIGSGFMPGTLCALECACDNWGDLYEGSATITDYLAPFDYNSPATPARWT